MSKNFLNAVRTKMGKFVFIIISIIILSFIIIYSEDAFNKTTEQFSSDKPVALENGKGLIQELPSEDKVVDSIDIQFATYARQNNGSVTVEFFDDSESIQVWDISSDGLKDNEYYCLKLDTPEKMEKNRHYFLKISEVYEGENYIAVYISSTKKERHSLSVDGENWEGTLCYYLTYKNLESRKIFIALAIIIFLSISILIIVNIKEAIIMEVMLLIAMTAYMWLCPLGMAPDERNHFFRTYEVSYVSLISKTVGETNRGGDYLPQNIREYENKDIVLDKNNLTEQPFENTALYSPVSYLPQVLGMKVAGLFSSKVSTLFYGAKMGNAIFAFLLCSFALWMMPFGKRILFLLMTFPLSLQEMVSISPDGFTMALSFFLFAYIFKLKYNSEKINNRDVIILALVSITIALCKIVYVVLIGLLFLLPSNKFESKKKEYLTKIGIIVVAFGLNLVWLKIASKFLTEFNPGVDSPAQVKFILTHLGTYYGIVVRTVVNDLLGWVSTMVGSSMGALSIGITGTAWLTAIVLLIYETCNVDDCDFWGTSKDLILLAFIFFIGVALILTSLYVQWTPLKKEVIEGLQGRYFIPILAPLLFFVIMMRQKKIEACQVINKKSLHGVYYIIIIFYNMITISDMIKYYIEAGGKNG